MANQFSRLLCLLGSIAVYDDCEILFRLAIEGGDVDCQSYALRICRLICVGRPLLTLVIAAHSNYDTFNQHPSIYSFDN
jgi:hypothetical protein